MRIVTRPDFDGVVCAVLLYETETIDQPICWMQPNEVQMGRADIRTGDILANLPFDRRCSLWFDHHYTNRPDEPFNGAFSIAPSAAGVIFAHYRERFQKDLTELVAAADKIDSADLSMDEVMHPENYPYVLLSMTIDDQDPAGETYWNRLVDLLGTQPMPSVLDDPTVAGQCERAVERNRVYRSLLEKHTVLQSHVSITDFRPLGKSPEGNRFLVYSIFPETSVSVKIRYADSQRKTVRISIGHSIFNDGCRVNVGLMLAEFEGGGHRAAGGCAFPADRADDYLPQIIDILLKNENNEPR